MPQDEHSTDRKYTAYLTAGLMFATLLVYWEVQYYDFVSFDDYRYVVENEMVLNGLNPSGIATALFKPYFSNWHPLTMLSYMFDATFFGTGPRGFHTVNLLLHLLNTGLLFLVLQKMTKALWPSAVVAALFALHPLHVESVAWISSRKDVLSGTFWILTIWAYFEYTRDTTRRRFVAVCALFLLGIMSKPMVVTLPFLLLLLDYWPLNRYGEERKLKWERVRALTMEKIPLFIMAGISIIITFYASVEGDAVRSLEQVPLADRLMNTPVAYVVYVLKMFWPTGLCPGGYVMPRSVQIWHAAGAVSALAAISLGALLVRKRQPFLLVGWFWFLGTLVPVIGIVSIGFAWRTDRYTYLPMIGLFVALVWGLAELLKNRRHGQRVLASAAIVVLVASSVLSWRQLGYWRDSKSMWFRILEVSPRHPQAHFNVGLLYAKDNELREAIRYFMEAIELNGNEPQTLVALGSTLLEAGYLVKAEEALEIAVREKPDYVLGYFQLAQAEQAAGKLNEAEEHLEKALELKPDYIDAMRLLESVRQRRGSG